MGLPRNRSDAILAFLATCLGQTLWDGLKHLPRCSKRVKKLIIAIDGPAASGKSTTAKLVADRLAYTYIDSGAMYRAVALRAMRLGVSEKDADGLERVAREAAIELPQSEEHRVILDGEDVSREIRDERVTASASVVSAVPGVRRALVKLQREIGHATNCVMEGRDIGTVVFPDADLKVFLTADLRERASRRLAEMRTRGVSSDLDGRGDEELLPEVTEEIRIRDERDSTRKDSPLLRASDAVALDTTGLSIEQQVEEVVRLAAARGARMPADGKAERG